MPRGHKPAIQPENKHVNAGADAHPRQRLRHIDALSRCQIDGPDPRKLRLEHIRDQFRLGDEAHFTLKHKTVAERIHEQDARNQDDQRHHVEDHDLARQRGPVQRDKPAAATICAQLGFDDTVRRNPVLPQKNPGAVLRSPGFRSGLHN